MTAKLKRISPRSQDRMERSMAVLFGLIEIFIATGRPIGSSTLQRGRFAELSSATIRNYLAAFEEAGLLSQGHSSAGRVPTAKAFRLYAEHASPPPFLAPEIQKKINTLQQPPSKEIASYLQLSTAVISEASGCAAFCLSPRFDQDMIIKIRLVPVDTKRLLAVLITKFGLVFSELVTSERWHLPDDLNDLETLLENRLHGRAPTVIPSKEAVRLVEWLYTELLMRHMTRSGAPRHSDFYRLGLSQLLSYPELATAEQLSPAVALFEHPNALRELCLVAIQNEELTFWIGNDLPLEGASDLDCAAAITPYRIGNKTVGAIGVLGPLRLPYGEISTLLETAASLMTDHLTRSLYQFKLSFRAPEAEVINMGPIRPIDGTKSSQLYIEDHRYSEEHHESN